MVTLTNLDLDLVVAFYFRNVIMKLPELQLTNQNKRRYHLRFNSVNQLFAILTYVAPKWQRHSAKESCLKQRQNIADPRDVWAKLVQAFYHQKSVNLPLIAKECFLTDFGPGTCPL